MPLLNNINILYLLIKMATVIIKLFIILLCYLNAGVFTMNVSSMLGTTLHQKFYPY